MPSKKPDINYRLKTAVMVIALLSSLYAGYIWTASKARAWMVLQIEQSHMIKGMNEDIIFIKNKIKEIHSDTTEAVTADDIRAIFEEYLNSDADEFDESDSE